MGWRDQRWVRWGYWLVAGSSLLVGALLVIFDAYGVARYMGDLLVGLGTVLLAGPPIERIRRQIQRRRLG